MDQDQSSVIHRSLTLAIDAAEVASAVLGSNFESVEADVPFITADVGTKVLTEDGDLRQGGGPGGVCSEHARVTGGGLAGDKLFVESSLSESGSLP